MALELDPVAAAVLAFMESKAEIEIGVTLLHSALEQIARKQHTGRLPLDWPSMAHHFSGRCVGWRRCCDRSESSWSKPATGSGGVSYAWSTPTAPRSQTMLRATHRKNPVKEPQEPQEPQKEAARMGLKFLRLLRLKTRRLLTHRAKHEPRTAPSRTAKLIVSSTRLSRHRAAGPSVCGAVLPRRRRGGAVGWGMATHPPCHQASQQPQEPPPPRRRSLASGVGRGPVDARARADHPDQHPLPAGARPEN